MIKNPEYIIARHKQFFEDGERNFLLGLFVRHKESNIFSWQEMLDSPEKALRERLNALSLTLQIDSDILPPIMHNRMLWPVASMFGAPMETVNGNAWVLPVIKDIHMVWDMHLPSLTSGYMPKVIEALQYFKDHAPPSMPITPPSEHGPLNIATMLRGKEFFTDIYDHPIEVHRLLDMVTETILAVERCYKDVLGEPQRYRLTKTGYFVSGIRLAIDSNINISPEMIEQFEMPYLSRIADEFGNLAVHYCGVDSAPGYHLARTLAKYEFITALDTQIPVYFSHDPTSWERDRPKLVAICESSRLEDFILTHLERLRHSNGIFFYAEPETIEEAVSLLNRWPRLRDKLFDGEVSL